MDNNYCIMCNKDLTEGYGQVCYNCRQIAEKPDNRIDFAEFKKELWRIIAKEGIEVTNQNLDWLLERAFKEIAK